MADISLSKPRKSEDRFESMQTTPVDKVAGLLLSLVLMIGIAVVMLGCVYFISTFKADPLPIVMLEDERIAGRGDHAAGFERDLEPPGAEEVEQLSEPSIETTLQSLAETVSNLSATLDTVATGASGTGSGKGDSRPPGPEGEGDDIVPRFDRWELRFSARDLKSYAAQLEFFKIELAAIGGGRNEVDYVSDLAGKLEHRVGKGEDEKRLYFINRRESPLLKYERDLLVSAKVAVASRQILKMIPKELENELAILEKTSAMQKRGNDVKVKEFGKTIFECQPNSPKGFRWVVIDQRFRTPGK
jgi:hypothetical protein